MFKIPRQSRKLAESKTYHVMIRGNEEKPLFLDDEDRTRFIDTLFVKSRDKNWYIYAYCLMNNHVHLLINEGSDQIGTIMKRINVSYAFYFNKKYKRVGHLFQDRFKSEVIDTDEYILSAVRYIHNNPVKAGLSATPEEYKWSSYNLFMGNVKPLINLVETCFILEMFSGNTAKAIELLMQYTSESNNDDFIEYKEEYPEDRPITSRKEAEDFIRKFINGKLKSKDELQLKENKETRDTLIRELKRLSSLSIRELGDILSLSRNIIQRVK